MLSRLKSTGYLSLLFCLLCSTASYPISRTTAFLGTATTGGAVGLATTLALKGNWRLLAIPAFWAGLFLSHDYFFSRTPLNKIKRAEKLLKEVKRSYEENCKKKNIDANIYKLENAIRLLNEACIEDSQFDYTVTARIKQINAIYADLKIKKAEQLLEETIHTAACYRSSCEENCEKNILDDAKGLYCVNQWPLVKAVESLTAHMSTLTDATNLVNEARTKDNSLNDSAAILEERINTVYTNLFSARKIIILSKEYSKQFEQYKQHEQRQNELALQEKRQAQKDRERNEEMKKAIEEGIRDGLARAQARAHYGPPPPYPG